MQQMRLLNVQQDIWSNCRKCVLANASVSVCMLMLLFISLYFVFFLFFVDSSVYMFVRAFEYMYVCVFVCVYVCMLQLQLGKKTHNVKYFAVIRLVE